MIFFIVKNRGIEVYKIEKEREKKIEEYKERWKEIMENLENKMISYNIYMLKYII